MKHKKCAYHYIISCLLVFSIAGCKANFEEYAQVSVPWDRPLLHQSLETIALALPSPKAAFKIWLRNFLGLAPDQMRSHMHILLLNYMKKPTFWVFILGVATIGGYIASKVIPKISDRLKEGKKQLAEKASSLHQFVLLKGLNEQFCYELPPY